MNEEAVNVRAARNGNEEAVIVRAARRMGMIGMEMKIYRSSDRACGSEMGVGKITMNGSSGVAHARKSVGTRSFGTRSSRDHAVCSSWPVVATSHPEKERREGTERRDGDSTRAATKRATEKQEEESRERADESGRERRQREAEESRPRAAEHSSRSMPEGKMCTICCSL